MLYYLRWNLFIITLQGRMPATLLKIDSNTITFLLTLSSFKEYLFLQKTSGGCFFYVFLNFLLVGFGALLTVAKKWKIFLGVGLVLCLLGLIFAIVGGVEINKHKDDLKSEVNTLYLFLHIVNCIKLGQERRRLSGSSIPIVTHFNTSGNTPIGLESSYISPKKL